MEWDGCDRGSIFQKGTSFKVVNDDLIHEFFWLYSQVIIWFWVMALGLILAEGTFPLAFLLIAYSYIR